MRVNVSCIRLLKALVYNVEVLSYKIELIWNRLFDTLQE